jgi:hypothetical protein
MRIPPDNISPSKQSPARRITLFGFIFISFAAFFVGGSAACKRRSAESPVRVRADLVLPRFRIDRTPQSELKPWKYKKDYLFTQDWFSNDVLVWNKVLDQDRNKPGLVYLEIGAFEGRSILWILENILTDSSSRAVVIDPFTGDYKDRYLANLEKSGMQDRVKTITGFSQIELRSQPLDSFDLVYIDGSHQAADVLEDAILSMRLLKKGGLLIFDDYQWKPESPAEDTPGPGIDTFYALFGRQFDVVHSGYQVILRKK